MGNGISHGLVEIARLCLWLALLAVVLVPLERLFALHPVQRRRNVWPDVGFYFLNSLLPALILSVPAAGLVALGHALLPESLLSGVAGLPLWQRLLAAFVIGEFGFYWGHRWTHEVPILWRFHAVHHRPEHMDWLVNTRSHPVDMVFVRLCGLAPLYLVGLAQANDAAGNVPAAAVVVVGTFWGFVLHANVRWRLGWLEAIVASPFFHHWHHNREGAVNRNYAAMLPALDRLFGTHHRATTWPDSYGISEAPPVRSRSDGAAADGGVPAPASATLPPCRQDAQPFA